MLGCVAAAIVGSPVADASHSSAAKRILPTRNEQCSIVSGRNFSPVDTARWALCWKARSPEAAQRRLLGGDLRRAFPSEMRLTGFIDIYCLIDVRLLNGTISHRLPWHLSGVRGQSKMKPNFFNLLLYLQLNRTCLLWSTPFHCWYTSPSVSSGSGTRPYYMFCGMALFYLLYRLKSATF
jgi:hypothetical protein